MVELRTALRKIRAEPGTQTPESLFQFAYPLRLTFLHLAFIEVLRGLPGSPVSLRTQKQRSLNKISQTRYRSSRDQNQLHLCSASSCRLSTLCSTRHGLTDRVL